MDAAMSDAAYRIADTIDQYIAGLYAQADAPSVSTYVGASGTNISISSGNVMLTLSYAQRYLTERNVPTNGRWMVIPPWLHQKLVLNETGVVSATAVPKIRDDGVIINGYVGTAMGFELFVSNNVSCASAAGQYRVLCGDNSAISYGGQVSEVEVLRLQDYFANAARGLYIYGAKVTRSEALLTNYLIEVAG
jgi:hypothetical protein